MARQLRIEYDGAIYHLMSRGDRREDIFRDDHDRKTFLKTLADTCAKTGWRVHAYCLMSNHFHLIVETPQPTLVAGMKWFLGTYTQRFNTRHQLRGHLFAGRYKSVIIDESDPFYFRTVCDYVHLNPVRAGLLNPDQWLSEYPWSSLPLYLEAPAQRPEWLETQRLLGELGLHADNGEARREFLALIEQRRRLGDDEEMLKKIRRGWHFGAPDFTGKLEAKIAGRTTKSESLRALERDELMEVKARRIIAEFLAKQAWDAERLKSERKSHPIKIDLAVELRNNTSMSVAWIAAELHAGKRGTLSNELSKRLKA
jgi:REP element-mobilizing transposase RayT